MAQNIIVSLFEVESEAYQALSELKKYEGSEKSFLMQAVLVKKENGALQYLDGFDTGNDTLDDMAVGGLVGALFGILGGPLGVLLGGSYGALIGSAVDAGDALDDATLLERISGKLVDGEVAVICLAYEEDESVIDGMLNKFKTVIARFDADVVADEVEEAARVEEEMARAAKQELRAAKKAEKKQNREDRKAKRAAEFEAFKAKFKKDKE
jgi:uncharacterized membrane protein